jgi:hypothetical protein
MSLWLPLIANAQAAANTPTIKLILYRLSYYVLNPVIKLGFVIALLVFMWGVVDYIRDRNSGHLWNSSIFDKEADGGARTSAGGDRIMYGLLGLFIMASAFGIATLIRNIVGSTIPIQ